MQSPQSLSKGEELMTGPLLIRERIWRCLCQGQDLLDQGSETIGAHPFREGIDGQESSDASGLQRCI